MTKRVKTEKIEDYIPSGTILRKYRVDSGFSQSELSKKLKVSITTISKIENNITGFRDSFKDKICSFLKVTNEDKSLIEKYESLRNTPAVTQNILIAKDEEIKELEEIIFELEKQISEIKRGKEIVEFLEKKGWVYKENKKES